MSERKLISLTKPNDKNNLSAVNPDDYGYKETKKSEFIHNDIEYKTIDGEIYPMLKNNNSSKNIYQQIIIEAGKCQRSDMMYETINALDDDMKNYQGCLNIVRQKAIQDKLDYSDVNNWGVWFIKDVYADKVIFPYNNINIGSHDIADIDNNYLYRNDQPVHDYYSSTVYINDKPYMIIARNYYRIFDIKSEFLCKNQENIIKPAPDVNTIPNPKQLILTLIIMLIIVNAPVIILTISFIIRFMNNNFF